MESEAGACSGAVFNPGDDGNQRNYSPRSGLLVFNLLKPCSCHGLSSLALCQAPVKAQPAGLGGWRAGWQPKPMCPPLEIKNILVHEKWGVHGERGGCEVLEKQ